MRHLAELVAELHESFAARTTHEWMTMLGEAGVPVGPVASIGEMLEHPQTVARDMVIEVEHTRLGAVRSLGSPVKLSGPPGGGARSASREARRGAPLLGEHTRDVLLENGWSDQDIDALAASGVLLTV
jgi:crotonobetainyl-CoA:carnitine CoA-transferase CaiB-like acyl-CoA transferase